MIQSNNNLQEHSENSFLKENFNSNKIGQHHKDSLGFNVPEGYFSKSKKEILDALPKVQKRKSRIFGLQPIFAYPIAASLILLIGITIWFQNSNLRKDQQITETEENETRYLKTPSDAILINSLLVENSEIDYYMDNYIINEIIVEANNSENKLDAILINSFFIKDSLIDDYFEEILLDNLLL